MIISLSTVSPWIVDKIIYPLLSLALPKGADKLMSRWFERHLFIDDIYTSINDKSVIFDVRVSNTSDLVLSLTNLNIKIFNPPVQGTFYRSAFQDSSANYEVFDRDGKLITNVGNEHFFDFSSIESKGNFIFQSRLMQKIHSKDTDRFKVIIHLAGIKVNPELKQIEALIKYSFHGKDKIAKLLKKL